MKQYRAYQFRIYPNDSQAALIQRTFGCCRFVYNHYLALQLERYEKGEPYLSKTKANNHCNQVLKDEYPFLREVDKYAVTNAIWNLDSAFQSFFKRRTGFPNYKSKHHSRKAYRTCYSHGNVVIMDHAIKLPKLKAVRAKVHRDVPADWIVKSATVSQTKSGKYYCSVLFEYETDEKAVDVDVNNAVGLDYKSDGLFATNYGRVCGSPKYYRKSERKLDREHKKLSRKKQGSRNYEKQRKRLAKQYEHIANQRKDFLHKEALKLAEQYDVVVIEDLDAVLLSGNALRNGKATMDNGWGMFIGFLQYKLEERGKVLIRIDRYYPSSQKCCLCGSTNKAVKALDVREWECPVCHAIHDRDLNAAVNICREGLRLYGEQYPVVA